MPSIAARLRRRIHAPDKIRNLGTAGAIAGVVQCVVRGGEKRPVEMTSQKVGDWCRATSGRDWPATGGWGELSIKIETETSVRDRERVYLGDMKQK